MFSVPYIHFYNNKSRPLPITSSAVTVQVRTDKHVYLQTAGYAALIVPGGKVAVNITVPYLDAAEGLVAGGVTVYNAFFD
jgi:hypothetical protein